MQAVWCNYFTTAFTLACLCYITFFFIWEWRNKEPPLFFVLTEKCLAQVQIRKYLLREEGATNQEPIFVFRSSLLFQFQDFSSSSSTVWWRKMSGNSGGFTSASDVSDLKNILVRQPHILRTDLTLSVRRKTNLGWFTSPVCVVVIQRGATLHPLESWPNPDRLLHEHQYHRSTRSSRAPQTARQHPPTPARETRPAGDQTWVRRRRIVIPTQLRSRQHL